MFKSAYISEFSFSEKESVDSVIKSHLLSNEKIIIPAETCKNTIIGDILSSNIRTLGNGSILIAHGSDSNTLLGYTDKHPEIKRKKNLIDIFQYFDERNLRAVYSPDSTIMQFNRLMKECAVGNSARFNSIFENKKLCEDIVKQEKLFNLTDYLSIIDNNISNNSEKELLYAHAAYFYNYFGSFSTNACNTLSLEKTTAFDYISSGSIGSGSKLTELEILISCALDITEGIEDFSFIENLKSDFLDKLSYQDVLEIRNNWMHGKVIEKYDKIVQECAASYLNMTNGNYETAIIHLERAFEIRQDIVERVFSGIKAEVRAYKIYRLSKFLADTAISSLSYLSGFDLIKSIIQGVYSATTEVAVLTNREKQLKKLVGRKFNKIKHAHDKAYTTIGGKSLVVEYLRIIENRLEKYNQSTSSTDIV